MDETGFATYRAQPDRVGQQLPAVQVTDGRILLGMNHTQQSAVRH